MSPVGGDKSYVIGLGGSDMEIRDCLATYSFLFGLWQGTHINPFCEADKMDARGDYQSAAEMRCGTHSYKKRYGKGQACIDAVIYVPPHNPKPVIIEAIDDEYEDRIKALEELFDKQQQAGQQRQQIQQQQYEKIQHAEDLRQRKIDLIREEFGEQTTTASH